MFQNCISLLQDVNLSLDIDKWIWKLSEEGNFLVAYNYHFQWKSGISTQVSNSSPSSNSIQTPL